MRQKQQKKSPKTLAEEGIQVSLDGRKIEGRFWKYEGRKVTDMVDKGEGNKTYPPAVFFRLSKAGDSLYGFVPDEGIKKGHSLVMNRGDLLKLLKGESDFVKAGILEPTSDSKPSAKKDDDLEGL